MSNADGLLSVLEAQKLQLEKILDSQTKNKTQISRLRDELRRRKAIKYGQPPIHKDQVNTKSISFMANNEYSDNHDHIIVQGRKLGEQNKDDGLPGENNDYLNHMLNFRFQKKGKSYLYEVLERISRMTVCAPLSKINNRTLSMYAVAEIVNDDATFKKKILFSFGALLLTCVQCYLLILIIAESTHIKCVAMTDCQPGTYCGFSVFNHPVCLDCFGIQRFPTNLTQCLSLFPTNEWETMDRLELDHGELRVEASTDATIHQCFSLKFCNRTDLDMNTNFKERCDFLVINKSRMDGGTWLLILFLALLWTVPVCKNMEKAHIEEWFLDNKIGGFFSIPVEIMRLALRLDIFLLPPIATVTTLVLVLTDKITSKVIVLNFLSVIFIIEADSVLGVLFLRKYQRKLMKMTIQDVKLKVILDMKPVFFWTRVHGLCYVGMMLIILSEVDKSVQECNRLPTYLWESCVSSYILFVIAQWLFKICPRNDGTTMLLRFILASLDVSRNGLSLICDTIQNGILYYGNVYHVFFFKLNPLSFLLTLNSLFLIVFLSMIEMVSLVLNGNAYVFTVFIPQNWWLFTSTPLMYIVLNFLKQKIQKDAK